MNRRNFFAVIGTAFASIAGLFGVRRLPSADPTAATLLGQRVGERLTSQVVSRMTESARETFKAGEQMIKRQSDEIRRLSEENRELFIALRDQLAEAVKHAHEQRMAEMQFTQSTAERRKLAKLVPEIANRATGRDVFPGTAMTDTDLVESLADNCTEEEVRTLTGLLRVKAPEIVDLITARFREVAKKRRGERKEINRLARQILARDGGKRRR